MLKCTGLVFQSVPASPSKLHARFTKNKLNTKRPVESIFFLKQTLGWFCQLCSQFPFRQDRPRGDGRAHDDTRAISRTVQRNTVIGCLISDNPRDLTWRWNIKMKGFVNTTLCWMLARWRNSLAAGKADACVDNTYCSVLKTQRWTHFIARSPM